MPTPVFLISLQRSGTNLLRGIIDGHPEICACLGEPFETAFNNRWDYYEYAWSQVQQDKSLFLPSEKNCDQLFAGFLKHLGGTVDENQFVFDIKYNSMHLLNPAWWERHRIPFILSRIAKERFSVIHLRRRNLLEVYCSMLRARESQVFTSYSKDQDTSDSDPAVAPLTISTSNMLTQLRYWDREIQYYQALLRDLHCPTLELSYEDLLADGKTSETVRQSLAAHLGVSDEFLSQPSTRKLGRPLDQSVENYGEVRDALLNSEFCDLVQRTA